MANILYNHIFSNSDIEYTDLQDVKETIDNFCNEYDILSDDSKKCDFGNTIKPEITIKLMNMLPNLKNDLLENILFSKIVDDINNISVEDFAYKYNLNLDNDINIVDLINSCHT